METPVLTYASGRERRCRRHFHVWLLPIVWLPGAWASVIHHGDEFFAFGMANLPSAVVVYPLLKVLELLGSNAFVGQHTFPGVVAIGFALWAAIGWILDRLRAWRWVYGLIPIAFFVIVKSRVAVPPHIPPLADYPGQEWEWDAVAVAHCWAVYVVALTTLIGATTAILVRWGVRRVRPATPAHSGR